MFNADLRSFLVGRPEIFAKVNERIYPLRKSQSPSDYPAVTYQDINERPTGKLEQSASDTVTAIYQIMVWSRSYDEAAVIADLIETALTEAAGITASVSSVQSAECIRGADGKFSQPLKLYSRIKMFEFWFDK